MSRNLLQAQGNKTVTDEKWCKMDCSCVQIYSPTNLTCEPEMLGLFQVRDILYGKLRFSHSVVEEDGEISISDNHFQQVASPGSDLTEASAMAFGSVDNAKK